MILHNIITTSLERGINDDDDVIDLKTYFFFVGTNLCELFPNKQIFFAKNIFNSFEIKALFGWSISF